MQRSVREKKVGKKHVRSNPVKVEISVRREYKEMLQAPEQRFPAYCREDQWSSPIVAHRWPCRKWIWTKESCCCPHRSKGFFCRNCGPWGTHAACERLHPNERVGRYHSGADGKCEEKGVVETNCCGDYCPHCLPLTLLKYRLCGSEAKQGRKNGARGSWF